MATDSARNLIITYSGQPGDTIHVAGALALDNNTDALVLYRDTNEDLDGLLRFYDQAAGQLPHPNGFVRSASRVKAYRTGPSGGSKLYDVLKKTQGNDWLKHQDSPEYQQVLKSLKLTSTDTVESFVGAYLTYVKDNNKKEYNRKSVGWSTTVIADIFRPKKDYATPLYELLAKILASRVLEIPHIINQDGTFGGVKLPAPGKKILLLWARYSGHNKVDGYNPGGDSSIEGQKQLLKVARSAGFTVITLGHDLKTPQDPNNPKKVEGDCHLGEFYNQLPEQDRSRAAQLSFFLALMQRYPGQIIQMGQKTGGMDSGALVGIPTIYIEDKLAPWPQQTRMKQWIGAVPFYDRVLTASPPSTLGQASRKVTAAIEEIEKHDPEFPAKFREISPEHRRVITLLYALKDTAEIKKLLVGLKNSDLTSVMNWVEANDVSKINIDEVAKKYLPEGYVKEDEAKFASALEAVIKGYYDNEKAIIRDVAGVYLPREFGQ